MRNTFSLPFALAIFLVAQPFVAAALALAENSWPQWRGAAQNGVASGKEFPLKWDEDSAIAWKTDIDGKGGSTPVVGGSTAYLTSGVDGRNLLMAIDTENGQLRWQVDLGEDRGHKHKKGSGSNPSAIVDGDSVFAYFRSGDLACVDTSGKVRWKTNLQQQFGEDTLWWDLGSSPTVTKSAVVVAVMQTGPSYLVALDKESGDLLWKTDRMLDAPVEAAQSYITPLIVQVDGRDVIAVMGADHLTLHAADSGKEIGRLGGFNPVGDQNFRSISSPVAEGNLIVCPYARGTTVTAVRMDQLIAGKGERCDRLVSRRLGKRRADPRRTRRSRVRRRRQGEGLDQLPRHQQRRNALGHSIDQATNRIQQFAADRRKSLVRDGRGRDHIRDWASERFAAANRLRQRVGRKRPHRRQPGPGGR